MPAVAYLAASVPLRMAGAGAAAAIPILAVQRLDDIALGGLLVGASLAPSILVAPLVGVALDRARSPRLLILAAGVVTAAAFVVAAFLGSIPTAAVAIALLVSGAASPFYFGGLSAFAPQAFADESRAYAADALSYNLGAVAGPAVAVAAGSARAAMIALGVIALIGSAALLGLRLRSHSAGEAERPRVLQQIASGLRYLVAHRPLAVVTVAGTITQFGQGALPIAAIALAVQRAGSPDRAAWFVTSFAIGALLGTLAATAWPAARIPSEWQMGAGFAATGAVLLVAIPDVGLGVTLAVVAVSGLFTAHSTAAMLLLRKQQSPAPLRSQVFTVGAGFRQAAGAIGAAVAGLIATTSAGFQVALIAAVWMLGGALVLAYPRGTRPVPESA